MKTTCLFMFMLFIGLSLEAQTQKKQTQGSKKTVSQTKKQTVQNPTTVTDIDGNIYKTVKIGNQIWMAENLRTTKFNDGTPIPLVTNNEGWNSLITPGYCWYNNNKSANKNTYGALYNWYAVNSKKLAPKGWHVPTDEEWATLNEYLGGQEIAGGKLKETGTVRWTSPNTGATNETGFTAIPGGNRDVNGSFMDLGLVGSWWSSTEVDVTDLEFKDDDKAWIWGVLFNNIGLARFNPDARSGNSVRCVKN